MGDQEPKPVRKAILYVVDPTTGKTYPVKVTLTGTGTVLLPVSFEKDGVGLATEATLSGIKTQTDKFVFDEDGRVSVGNPPNLDIKLSEIRAVGTQSVRTLSDLYSNISGVIDSVDSLRTRLADEGGMRCYEVTVPTDNTFAVPTGESRYVKELYIAQYAQIYVDGDLKVV